MKPIFLFSFITTLAIMFSCSKKNDCEVVQFPIEHFESKFNCDNTKYISSLNINIYNNCKIITSQASFDSLVTGNCHPVIDFSKYDLVIGRQSTGNEYGSINYDLHRNCPEKELILTVDIIQSAATRPDNILYHALIPKLSPNDSLIVKVIVH